MTDFNHIKTILLKEYETTGKRNEKELKAFLEGMTCLQDYIESNQEETRLNEYVTQEQRISCLQRQLETADKKLARMDKLKEENTKLKNTVATVSNLSKSEFKEFKRDERIKFLVEELEKEKEKNKQLTIENYQLRGNI